MAGRQKKVQAALVQSKLEDFTAAAAKTPAFTTNMEKFISDAVVDRSFDKVCAAAYDPLGKATGVKDPASVKASAGQAHSTLFSGIAVNLRSRYRSLLCFGRRFAHGEQRHC